jgi:Protein of unknown function (DUF2628)
MSTYTVHVPPPRLEASDPDQFLFVRDGFYVWAFLLAPLWLFLHRLWLVLLGYLVLGGLLGAVFYLTAAPALLKFFGNLLVALLMGFEAGTLWRWTSTRRGWRMVGFAVGDGQESAERRFFAEWTKRAGAAMSPAEAPLSTPVRRGPPSGSDIIGLFPEPRP